MASPQTIRLDHIRKSFGSQRALDDVSLEFCPGLLHALVGANGAGKSTLGWLLAGRFCDYVGRIFVDEKPVKLTCRRKSIEHGIHIVTQEPALALNLSIAANLFLGAEPVSSLRASVRTGGLILKAAQACLADFGLELDASALVRQLTLAQRQSVDLLRAYMRKPSFLVVDEPPLSTKDSLDSIFEQVAEKLRGTGTHLLLITHQVSKALSMADTVTVMRDGQIIATRPTRECSQSEVVKLMFPSIVSVVAKKQGHDGLRPVSETKSLNVVLTSTLYGHPHNLTIRDGCITGLRTRPSVLASKILRCVVRIETFFEVVLGFSEIRFSPRSPDDALGRGILYLSADRELEAGFPNLSVRDNLTFHLLRGLAVVGIVRRGLQQAVAEKLAMQLDIDQHRLGDFLTELSGGNQQRTLLARVAGANPRLCLLDEPNRGVDVASLPIVESEIQALAKPNRWVVISSTDDAFLEEVSDHILELDFEDTRPQPPTWEDR